VRYTGFHAKEVWISKYCSDSREVESHREKYLVNDILLMGRYLDAPISPMTLPMVKDNQLFLDTLNIRGAQADGMSVGAIYMAKHRSGANDKTFVVGLVSLGA